MHQKLSILLIALTSFAFNPATAAPPAEVPNELKLEVAILVLNAYSAHLTEETDPVVRYETLKKALREARDPLGSDLTPVRNLIDLLVNEMERVRQVYERLKDRTGNDFPKWEAPWKRDGDPREELLQEDVKQELSDVELTKIREFFNQWKPGIPFPDPEAPIAPPIEWPQVAKEPRPIPDAIKKVTDLRRTLGDRLKDGPATYTHGLSNIMERKLRSVILRAFTIPFSSDPNIATRQAALYRLDYTYLKSRNMRLNFRNFDREADILITKFFRDHPRNFSRFVATFYDENNNGILEENFKKGDIAPLQYVARIMEAAGDYGIARNAQELKKLKHRGMALLKRIFGEPYRNFRGQEKEQVSILDSANEVNIEEMTLWDTVYLMANVLDISREYGGWYGADGKVAEGHEGKVLEQERRVTQVKEAGLKLQAELKALTKKAKKTEADLSRLSAIDNEIAINKKSFRDQWKLLTQYQEILFQAYSIVGKFKDAGRYVLEPNPKYGEPEEPRYIHKKERPYIEIADFVGTKLTYTNPLMPVGLQTGDDEYKDWGKIVDHAWINPDFVRRVYKEEVNAFIAGTFTPVSRVSSGLRRFSDTVVDNFTDDADGATMGVLSRVGKRSLQVLGTAATVVGATTMGGVSLYATNSGFRDFCEKLLSVFSSGQ